MTTVFKTGQTWNTLSHAAKWTDVPPAPLRVEDAAHDLALASNGAVATADSEYSKEPGCTDMVNDGVIATGDNFTNRWHSSVDSPHPHWVQIKLPHAEAIGTMIINFADPEGYAVDFKCLAVVDGKEREILQVNVLGVMGDASAWRQVHRRFMPIARERLHIPYCAIMLLISVGCLSKLLRWSRPMPAVGGLSSGSAIHNWSGFWQQFDARAGCGCSNRA